MKQQKDGQKIFEDKSGKKPALRNIDSPPIKKADAERVINKTKEDETMEPNAITTELIKALKEFGIDKI